MAGIRIEQDGRIAHVIMDHAPVNALTSALYAELGDVFLRMVARDDISVVVLRSGCEKAFCAGKDLKEFLGATIEDDPASAYNVRRTFEAIRHCPIPVIAAVDGPALGAGCVIAACADIRIASTRARFGMPEINVGRCGGTAHVGRLVPQGAMRLMWFTGDPIDAAEAYRIGLIDQLVEPDALSGAVDALAARIAAKSPLGLRVGKKSMNEAEELPVDIGYAHEQRYSTQLMRSDDAREATRAIVEKRPPVFTGK
ncbi:enoyl-CoA hydratase [Sphingomonas gilva]|uniref:Enoyl-CoA hydratase n=1 Tax=Sphingomonas gilva TaxID=2305907 RepID=A0A396RRU2_9SPHN|nr:enoyl-CoA hydratase-related protein [Sphingomonas gilva]RHW19240.1 enoyl-CoA hydratase [Sphingomonas gilva]